MSRKDVLFIGLIGAFAAGLWMDIAPRVSGHPALIEDKRNVEAIRATRPIVERIDAEFAVHWESNGIQSAELSDSLTICRRLSLALTGTVPSYEELRMLDKIAAADRVDWWIDHVFADRRYAEYLAERLARVYVGVEEGPFLIFRRRRFTTWLSDSLLANRPYDEMVRQLISEQGVWTEKPAVNFLTVTTTDGKPDEVRLAARTTRAFLGVRLDCMQCHDDNLGGEWLQSDFHELAAFFSEASNTITGVADKPRAYKTTYLDAETETAVTPTVPFQADIVTPHTETRRQRLAQWVTDPENKAFSRAITNRIWALLFGQPLVEPVDDIPLEGPYPTGLESLADDFAESGFDLQHLIRSIATTHVFQQSSRADFEITEEHTSAWAVFPVTRLRPEQIAGALVQSSKLTTINADSHILVRLGLSENVGDFVKRYGDTGEDEFDSHGGTIPQRLLMMNGNLVKERTKEDLVVNAATRIAAFSPSDEKAIRAAFLTILTREPTEIEAEHFLTSLAEATENGSTGKRRVRFFEDLCWSLLNCAEFSWNH